MGLTTLANVKSWLGLFPDKHVSAISKANPGIVTCADHGLQTGQQVILSGIAGMIELNGAILTPIVINDSSFSIGLDTSGYQQYTSGGFFGFDDVLISRLINSVSESIENYLGERVLAANYTDVRYIESGKTSFSPNHLPIAGITTLTVDGDVIPVSTNGSDGYLFDQSTIYLQGYNFSNSLGTRFNTTLVYSAGNATVPTSIEQAAIDWVSYIYRGKERVGQRSKTLAGETMTYLVDDIPPGVKSVLGSYPWRRVFV